MSTNNAETENSPENDERKPGDTLTPDSLENPAESTSEPENTMFSREYVEELRQEAAKHRTNSKKSDELAKRLVTSYVETSGRLHDPRDLPFSDELLGEDGYPDPAKVTAAVEALIKERPHLAKIRPVGDVGQGVTTEANTSGLAAFGNMLRDAAS